MEEKPNAAAGSTKSKELAKLIQAMPFFKDFTHEELKHLIRLSVPRQFQSEATIIKKGEEAKSFFILLQGKVEVLLERKEHPPLSIQLQEGQAFGEMALINSSVRNATCTAKTAIIALEIKPQTLQDTSSSVTLKVYMQLTRALVQRLNHLSVLIENGEAVIGSIENQGEEKATKSTNSVTFNILQAARKAKLQEKQQQAVVENASVEPVIEKPIKRDFLSPKKEEVEQKQEATTATPEVIEEEINPLSSPTAVADEIEEAAKSQEEYDVLMRKVNLRTEFIFSKIPQVLSDLIINKLYGYWTGGKLAKINPHITWDPKSFTEGSTRLLHALHMVVVCSEGEHAYSEAYLGLPFSHRAIGLPQVGCIGTFLGSDDAIDRFFSGKNLKKAVALDLQMPIDRMWHGKESIEFLTHTINDVHLDSLFLVFDEPDGKNTRRIRNQFPEHQIVTVVRGTTFDKNELTSIFTQPEKELAEVNHIFAKKDYHDHGFYSGQTLFLPDLSCIYEGLDKMDYAGHVFGTISLLAQVAPDYSGISWGSKGGAEGAVKASRAMFGLKGAMTASDIAAAVNWADNGK